MKLIVTGGIGSGKTTVVSHLQTLLDDYLFFDVDDFVRGLYQNDRISQSLMDAFGTSDRKQISDIVFATPSKKLELYDIINPRVISAINDMAKQDDIVFDMPLYFEMRGLIEIEPDLVLCVACSHETQVQRIKARNGFSDEKIQSIISQQLPVSEKKRLSDIVIDSNGTFQSMIDATTMVVANFGI